MIIFHLVLLLVANFVTRHYVLIYIFPDMMYTQKILYFIAHLTHKQVNIIGHAVMEQILRYQEEMDIQNMPD